MTPCRLVRNKCDVLKDCSAFVFRVKQSEESDPEDASSEISRNPTFLHYSYVFCAWQCVTTHCNRSEQEYTGVYPIYNITHSDKDVCFVNVGLLSVWTFERQQTLAAICVNIWTTVDAGALNFSLFYHGSKLSLCDLFVVSSHSIYFTDNGYRMTVSGMNMSCSTHSRDNRPSYIKFSYEILKWKYPFET